MRHAFIIAALAGTVYLHIYTGGKPPATQSPEGEGQTICERSGPVLMLASINASLQGERITVAGEIGDIWEPAGKRAPHTLILRDDSGALEIVHWLQHPTRVGIGDSVKCTGTVGLYRGRLQLRLWARRDLLVLDP